MNYQPDDLNSVKLLICYVLYNIESDIDSEALYEIAVDSGQINYFFYNEAIDELLVNDTIYSNPDENGKMIFSLSPKGIQYVKDFSTYVQRSLRDRIMYSAMEYKARQLRNASLSVECINNENGCTLKCSVSDSSKSLVDFSLFTESQMQAELIADRIRDDPDNFYSSFMNFLLGHQSYDENDITESGQ